MIDLIKQYQADVLSGVLIEDQTQMSILTKFQQLLTQLVNYQSWWRRLLGTSKPQGLYIWGGVGVGKTFVMDRFFEAIPFHQKRRTHFHAFMQEVQLSLRAYQGEVNPLAKVASDIAEQAKVLCFDEFFVNDIADAMILERLFSSLFERGVILVATSNIPPDLLYLHGLHRKRFQGAIDLIKAHCHVYHADSTQDYRFRALEDAGVYFDGESDNNEQQLAQLFDHYAKGTYQSDQDIMIEGRPIRYKRKGDCVIWFEFDALCQVPRSQVDYLALAQQFDVIFVSHVPIIPASEIAKITYFIHLVDVLYDQRVKLVLSAQAPVDALYTEGKKLFEYQRTQSRLHEMQSVEYLSQL